jgi:hypothetical protein
VVKNVFRLFQSWVDKHCNPRLRLGESLSALLKANGRYNNSLVLNLSKVVHLRAAFLAFSEGEAEEYVASSKIKDKKCHMEAISKYRELLLH